MDFGNLIRDNMDKMKQRQQDVKLRLHLGGNVFVSLTSGIWCVDIRQFFMPKGEEEVRPTREGIALRFGEYQKLCEIMPMLPDLIPALNSVQLCRLQDDHQNQEGAMQCVECNPNTWNMYSDIPIII